MLSVLVATTVQAVTASRAATLGVVQGLSEFIPVSSSAHLVLVPYFLDWDAPGLAFDVAVHIGTALAVIAYFGRDLLGIVAGTAGWVVGRRTDQNRAQARLLAFLALGTVPAAITGFLLEGLFEEHFASTEGVEDTGAWLTGIFLLGTAALLLLAERFYARRGEEGRPAGEVTALDALVVGLFQAVAILPGISRSGSTISAGIFRGLSREAAARFSFLLSLPAIIGAAILTLPDVPAGADLGPLVVGAAAAAVSGFAAIAFLLRYLRTRTMRPFAVYCVAIAAVTLAFWSQTR
jgi:undecaprenyl-diphosphatase